MTGFLDLPTEIRLQIYEHACPIGNKSPCYEISDYGCYEAENDSNRAVFDKLYDRHWPNSRTIRPQKLLRTLLPKPQSLLNMARTCRQLNGEVQEFVYARTTFQLGFGDHRSRRNVDNYISRGVVHGNIGKVMMENYFFPRGGISDMETQVLLQSTKLSLVICDTFTDSVDRERLREHLQELVEIVSLKATPLKLITISLRVFDISNPLKRRRRGPEEEELSRFQYLLEPLIDLRAERAVVEGTVERDFARRLTTVIEGQHGKGLTPLVYGVHPAKKRKTSKGKKGQPERSRRRYFEPIYDWTDVDVPELF